MSIFPGYLTNGQFLRNMKPAKYLELLLVGHSLDDLYSEISTAVSFSPVTKRSNFRPTGR